MRGLSSTSRALRPSIFTPHITCSNPRSPTDNWVRNYRQNRQRFGLEIMDSMELFTQHTTTRSSTNNTLCIKVSILTPLVIPRQYPSYAPHASVEVSLTMKSPGKESWEEAVEEDWWCHQTNHVFTHWGGNSNVMACNERPTGSFAAGGLP